MKILVLNGSPKGESSNTLRLTHAFCEGIQERAAAAVKTLHVCRMDVRDCLGCFACWSKTPGACVIRDDMAGVIEKILWADLVIWSFPLYYFSIPSRLKAVIDRQLPMNLPFMSKAAGGGHPSRYDLAGKRFVAISTCGFHTAQGNYDAVTAQLDRMYGPGGYTALFCGQGELFRVPELRQRTGAYLDWVRRAGREFAGGEISPETWAALETPLYPREVFEQMADASWGTAAPGTAQQDLSLAFTKQMAALYDPSAWSGRDQVVEFHYTDVDRSCQILLQKGGHQVLTENFLPYTTRIETPLAVWQRIARGEISGPEAMMQRLYTVEGDFDLMLRWDEWFGGGAGTPAAPEPAGARRANMALMLLPWMALWVALPIWPLWGAGLAILLSALLPMSGRRWRLTPFEHITQLAVTLLGLGTVFGGPVRVLLPLSYLLFGLMWTATVFLALPLSAYYSSDGYGGAKAMENPLFLRTNRILTACWGALYLVTPVWTWLLLGTPLAGYSGAVNSVLPALMGLFTIWFQRWYPKHYAARPRHGV